MREAKQKDALPEPKQCDHCCSLNIEFTPNDVLYGSLQGEWPYIWRCLDCGAAIGCHEGTRFPFGRMADKKTRALRRSAHEVFDVLWRSELMTRTKAYRWLSVELGIEFSQCHISWLTVEQLKHT